MAESNLEKIYSKKIHSSLVLYIKMHILWKWFFWKVIKTTEISIDIRTYRENSYSYPESLDQLLDILFKIIFQQTVIVYLGYSF